MNSDPTLTAALASAASLRHRLISGDTLRRDWQATDPTRAFLAVQDEVRLRADAAYRERAGWNIRLSAHGTLACHLTPFQKCTAKVDAALVEALMKLHGQHPAALVIQRSARRGLLEAVRGAIWTVQPAVVAAVEAALREYHAVRAPLRPLNAVQRLGYLDEEDEIRAKGEGRKAMDDFTPGKSYPLETETIEGQKVEQRTQPSSAIALRPSPFALEDSASESVLVTGQELLIRIRGESGRWHAFTHYRLGAEQEAARPEAEFHTLAELVGAFVIPEVADVATLHPARFAEMQRRLGLLEKGVRDFGCEAARTQRRAA